LISYGSNSTSAIHLAKKKEARDASRQFSRLKAKRQCGVHLLRTVRRGDMPYGADPLSTVCCKNRHSCPWCTPPALAEHRTTIHELAFIAERRGGQAIMGVLTIPKRNAHDLKYCYKQLLSLVPKFRRKVKSLEAKYGISGSLRTLEETYSEDTYWHPHVNYIWFFDSLLTVYEEKAFVDEMKSIWIDVASNSGIRGVQPGAQRFKPWIGQKAAKKLAEYSTKLSYFTDHLPKPKGDGKFRQLQPWQILSLARTGDPQWIKIWNDYELAMVKKHRVVYYNQNLVIKPDSKKKKSSLRAD
jgi:hypothetical protein